MTPEQFDRLQELFLDASEELEAAPAEAVRNWVDSRCDDSDVATELIEMLARAPGRTHLLEDQALKNPELLDALIASSDHPVIEGYTISREIARGGQSVVYEATQEATGQRTAIKVLLGREFSGEEERVRQDREVSILTRLSHPNIVGIIDRGRTESGIDFVVMPYIDGRSLGDHLLYLRHETLPRDNTTRPLELFVKIARAVGAAHEAGIVHRDLKPANIRIDGHGEPRILDFGLARVVQEAESLRHAETALTVQGRFLGSLPWASPEQARGDSASITPATDVYSLGVILYQLLTDGAFPYEVVGAVHEVLENILKSKPKPPSSVNQPPVAPKKERWLALQPKQLNRAIDSIVLRALSKSPEDRYETAGLLADDVEKYLAGEKIESNYSKYRASRLLKQAGIACAFIVVAAVCAGLLPYVLHRAPAGSNASTAEQSTETSQVAGQTYTCTSIPGVTLSTSMSEGGLIANIAVNHGALPRNIAKHPNEAASAVQLIESINANKPEALLLVMADRIPRNWPERMKQGIWPSHVARWGKLESVKPLTVDSSTISNEELKTVWLSLKHKESTRLAKAVFSPKGLEILALDVADTLSADGRVFSPDGEGRFQYRASPPSYRSTIYVASERVRVAAGPYSLEFSIASGRESAD